MRAEDVERIWQTWDEVAAITETATSDNGFVEVTVDAGGAVRGLRLDPRGCRRLDATTLADTIVATIADAAQLARRHAFESMAPLLPSDATFEQTDLAFDPIRHHLAQDGHHGR
jgi:DNA-binding protein YbaB